MELIDDLLIEVKQICIFNNNLSGKVVKKFRRIVFMSDIKDCGEYCYFVNGKIYNCSLITLRDGEWFKCEDKYDELKAVIAKWYLTAIEQQEKQN
jgi:hypothetical protein